MEWLALVGNMKLKELENEPDTHKPSLYKHKENILNIFTKVCNTPNKKPGEE